MRKTRVISDSRIPSTNIPHRSPPRRQAPSLVTKLRSNASPEVVSGTRGLLALVQSGEKSCVLRQDGLLDALAHVLHTAAPLARFFALATLGQLAYFSLQHSRLVAGHAEIRRGVVVVLRGGKGIEGEAAKVPPTSS